MPIVQQQRYIPAEMSSVARLCFAFLVVAPLVLTAAGPSFGKPTGKSASSTKKDPKDNNKDTTPPTIDHTPLTAFDPAVPLVVEAKIVDDKSGVFEPALLVRAAGSGAFTRVPMTHKDGAPDVYTAPVPPELMSGDIEYLVEAFDQSGNGPARVGDETAPLKITRHAQAAAATTTTTTATTTPTGTPPSKVDDDAGGPSGAVIGLGIAAGVVVLAG
ncbi:MAG TPA: hypothetical protein VGO62_11700, partial [Myxococcota bacterium]